MQAKRANPDPELDAEEAAFSAHEALSYQQRRGSVAPARVRAVGSRSDVLAGRAQRTKGGLVASDLFVKVTKVDPRTGRAYERICSRRASEAAHRAQHLAGNNASGVDYLRRKPAAPQVDGSEIRELLASALY